MERTTSVKRRRSRVRSRSPISVHYIDLTVDSPVTTTTAHGRRRVNNNNNIKIPSINDNNSGASSQLMETIDIVDTPDALRSRTQRKFNDNITNLNKPAASTITPNDLNNKDVNNDDSDNRIPAVFDSFHGLTPLTCPICYEDLRSSRKPMTTKCGHIFCESCIQATLSSRKKCPVCMASITIKSCVRLHY